jgi:hypothetical protein
MSGMLQLADDYRMKTPLQEIDKLKHIGHMASGLQPAEPQLFHTL